MAKKTSKKEAPAPKAKGKAKDAKEEKAKPEGPKYGINELAKELDINPASARVKLRKHGIEKVGGRYGWNTKAELDALIKKLKTEPDEEDEEEEEEEDEAEDEDEDEDEDDD